jgi:hypothetical protein
MEVGGFFTYVYDMYVCFDFDGPIRLELIVTSKITKL